MTIEERWEQLKVLRAQKKIFANAGAADDVAATEADIEIVNREIVEQIEWTGCNWIALKTGGRLYLKAEIRVEGALKADVPKMIAEATKAARKGMPFERDGITDHVNIAVREGPDPSDISITAIRSFRGMEE